MAGIEMSEGCETCAPRTYGGAKRNSVVSVKGALTTTSSG